MKAHAIYQNGDQFLSALEKKGVSQQLIQDLKQQIFTKAESSSKLYSMTVSEPEKFSKLNGPNVYASSKRDQRMESS